MFRKILQFILKILSKLVLWKYKPIIVAVTGSAGKTSTKEAIYAVLESHFKDTKIRRNKKNYNNEIGVPLTIFGMETGGKSILAWTSRFVKILLMLIFKEKYPKILILEMGADRPGDIGYLTKFIKPNVGIITAIGDIPAHIEFFKNPRELAMEKKKLLDALKSANNKNLNKVAILNYDDKMLEVMGKNSQTKVLSYGFEQKVDIRASNYESKLAQLDKDGIFGATTFKLNYKGSTVPVKLVNILGKHQIYFALAAAAVGTIFNLNLVDISEGLRSFKGLPGRMKMIKGIKNTLIIDDSYNAAPLSMLAALDTLKELYEQKEDKQQAIAILGDMLEIGKYTIEAHERIGRKVFETADILFAVGERARFIAKGAREKGMKKDKIFEFATAEEAKKSVQEKIEQGDIILIKASRVMKMEKIVKEIMAEPEKAKELLV